MKRDLAGFLSPRGIAVVGASEGTEKVGGRVMHSLIQHGYEGRLFAVNPRGGVIHGRETVKAIEELPDGVDLAFLTIPARMVADTLRECARKGIRNVCVGSSGFADAGENGRKLQDELVDLARELAINLAGPNAEGYFNVPARIAANFSPATQGIDPGSPGSRRRVGVVAQSGGLAYALYNQGRPRGIDFSTVIAIGNQADLEAADFIDALLDDPATHVVLVYLEGVKTPARFRACAERALELGKPLVVARMGASEAGRRAVASHTGSLAGSRSAWDAFCDRYGIVQAGSPEEMLDLALGFTRFPMPAGKRLAVITVSGGTAAWMVDVASLRGMVVSPIEEPLRGRLRGLLPDYGAASNPIDVAGHANDVLADALSTVLESAKFDAVVMVLSLAFDRRLRIEGEALGRLVAGAGVPVVLYSYTNVSQSSRGLLDRHGLTALGSMEAVGRYLGQAAEYSAARNRFDFAGSAKGAGIAGSVRSALPAGADILCEYEAKALLREYGIASPEEYLATTPQQAVDAAARIGRSVALKVQSPHIPHKTEARGIRLNLLRGEDIETAFAEIRSNALSYQPDADIRGLLVQPMAAPGVEMIIGVIRDPEFGPMVMCGSGGIHVEVFNDVAFALAPLDAAEAGRLLDRLKSRKLLDGVRGQLPADRAALEDLLVRVSRLASDYCDDIAEIDLNPVIVHAAGKALTIVDALVVRASGLREGGSDR